VEEPAEMPVGGVEKAHVAKVKPPTDRSR
jgi:hypothetical protein